MEANDKNSGDTKENVAIVVTQEAAIPDPGSAPGQAMSVHPGVMITALISTLEKSPDVDFDKVINHAEKLFELQKKYDDDVARKAYFVARAEFSGMAPTIFQDRGVDFETQGGSKTEFSFSTLAGALDQIREALRKCGLTPSWKLYELDNNVIRVTCYLTHLLGYQEETSFSAPRDAGKGSTGMNILQASKSTVSYLERITFFALLGLASKYDDDDGAGYDAPEPPELVTREQAASMETLFSEVGGDTKPLFDFFKVEKWEEISASDFDRVMKKLESRRHAESTT